MSINKNISTSLLTQIPVFILSVVSGIFITRILGVSEKGVFSLFQTNIQFFVLFFTFSMNTGITYFVANSKIHPSKIIGMALKIILIGSILISVVLFFGDLIGTDVLFFPDGYDSFPFKIFLFLSFISTVANTTFAAVFQGRSRFNQINLISLLTSVLQVIAFGIMWLLNNYHVYVSGINSVLVISLIILTFNTIYWRMVYRNEIGVTPVIVKSTDVDFRLFHAYIFSIYIGTLINFMNYKLDIWIVNYYMDEAQLGIYSLSGNIIQLFIMISVVVSSVMLPYMSKADSPEIRIQMLKSISRISFLFILIGAGVTFISCGFLIPLIYGVEFSDSVSPLRLILPGVIFSCSTQLFATFIVASNRNILNILATALALVATIILDFTLVPIYGIKGAAWATTFVYFFTFMLTFLFCVIKLKIPLGNYFIPSPAELKNGWIKIKSYVFNR